jgi:hypothetical protein
VGYFTGPLAQTSQKISYQMTHGKGVILHYGGGGEFEYDIFDKLQELL